MLANWTSWVCLFPSLISAMLFVVMGVLFVVCGWPGNTKDEKEMAGCGIVMTIVGLIFLVAIGIVLAIS